MVDKEEEYQTNCFTFMGQIISELGFTQRALMQGVPLSNKPIQNILNVVDKKTLKLKEPKFSSVTKLILYLKLSYTALELYTGTDTINELIKHNVVEVKHGLIVKPDNYHYRLLAYLKEKHNKADQ